MAKSTKATSKNKHMKKALSVLGKSLKSIKSHIGGKKVKVKKASKSLKTARKVLKAVRKVA